MYALKQDGAGRNAPVFEGSDAGQTVHIIGRWINTKGETGPISETVSATIPG